jgi:small subunit ribosomal protein S4e
MTNHQKRLSVPNEWPVERKTEKFTVKAGAGPHGESGVPLLIVLRDVLGYADSRKEARYALNQNNVVINGKPVSDEERPVGMFDIVTFREREEHYRVFPEEGGRLALTPIDAESAGSKLGKIVNKHHVAGGDVQLTLHDGQTLLVDHGTPYDAGDSLVVDNETDEIVAHFEFEEGALVTAVAGAHAGQIGEIEEIQATSGSSPNNVIAERIDEAAEGSFETIAEYVVVIDENFVDGGTSDGDESASEQDGDESDPESAGDEGESESAGDESESESASDESDPESAGDGEAEADSETDEHTDQEGDE